MFLAAGVVVAAAYVNDDNRHWLETYAYGFRGGIIPRSQPNKPG